MVITQWIEQLTKSHLWSQAWKERESLKVLLSALHYKVMVIHRIDEAKVVNNKQGEKIENENEYYTYNSIYENNCGEPEEKNKSRRWIHI